MADFLDKLNDSILAILSLVISAIASPFELARRWPGVFILGVVLMIGFIVTLQVLGVGK